MHEGYDIPIDIYLTGTTLHNYVNDYPDLVEKMINSDVVSISYHFRPPMPMYSGFDNIGLSGMDNQELYNTLISYSENKLDLETEGDRKVSTTEAQNLAQSWGNIPFTQGSAAVT